MRSKLVKESILKGPSNEEIYSKISDLEPFEILLLSAKNNFLKGVKIALEIEKDIPEEGLNEALYYASKNGYLNIIKYLVESGANIHDSENKALRVASEKGYLDIVKYLVEFGANIHALSDAPLLVSMSNGHLDIVKYLVEQGADISRKDVEKMIHNSYYNKKYPNIVNYVTNINK